MSCKKLTIGLDARSVHRGVRRGTGKNLRDLYRNVLELRPDWNVVGYHRGDDRLGIESPGYTGRRVEMRGDRFGAWQKLRLPLAAWRDGVDLLHCPANDCASWQPTATMVTIHDLLPYTDGPRDMSMRFARTARLAARRGLTVVTPSEYTSQGLQDVFGLDKDQIVVNPWAADSSMHRVDDSNLIKRVAAGYHIDKPYVLHFGAPDRRKNTRELIEAWAMVSDGLRSDVQLLVVGLDDREHRKSIRELAERLGVGKSVSLSGFAEEGDIPALLSGAEFLAYPSRCEGFGLPILDAWVAGTAVLSADNSAIPEVAGDGALLVDAESVESISDGLGRLLDQPSLRAALTQRGAERLKGYGWNATAERFIFAVEKALGGMEAQSDAA